ncbi:hypothetical protein BC835DRAFT_1274717 [Cytidiella melzeri]|nr:hypothetical protein BC835DRAFT_1274717 [Cytidiella melzeri]
MSLERTSELLPPLFGDGHGQYRIRILGNSGRISHRSTLGEELAAVLGVPLISLDSVYWKPGWQESTREELREDVHKLLSQLDIGWVMEGNYNSALGNMNNPQVTDTIWLDPPLALYFPRICVRTLRRLLRIDPPCSPGCDESVRKAFFSRNSILWWCLTHHMVVRKREQENLRTNGLHVGGTYRRIGGWGAELAAWKQRVRDMVAAGSVPHSREAHSMNGAE